MSGASWIEVLPETGVVGILGKRRQGKSGLSYYLAELRHDELKKDAAVLGPPESLRSAFPDWITIVREMRDFAEHPGKTCVIDEGSLPLHARLAMQKDHAGFDQVFSLCGQLGQLYIISTHHSRKLDNLMVGEYDVLAFKRPGKMQSQMERKEVRPLSEAARRFFDGIPEEDRKRWAFVYYDDLDETAGLENPLPSFWSDEISKAVSIAYMADAGKRSGRDLSDFGDLGDLNGVLAVPAAHSRLRVPRATSPAERLDHIRNAVSRLALGPEVTRSIKEAIDLVMAGLAPWSKASLEAILEEIRLATAKTSDPNMIAALAELSQDVKEAFGPATGASASSLDSNPEDAL